MIDKLELTEILLKTLKKISSFEVEIAFSQFDKSIDWFSVVVEASGVDVASTEVVVDGINVEDTEADGTIREDEVDGEQARVSFFGSIPI